MKLIVSNTPKRIIRQRIRPIACWLALVTSSPAVDANWTGNTNGNWSTANWSASPGPGTGDTATFNAASSNTAITTGAVTINTILFNTANAAAYTLGGGTITLNDSGAITVSSSVINNQAISSNVVLGTTSPTAGYSFTNDSAANGQLLTVSGSVSSGASNLNNTTKTLTLGGSGNGSVSGGISGDGSGTGQAKTAIVSVTKSGLGSWALTNANLYTGGTTITTGTLFANNTTGSATGTGAVSVTAGTLGGSGFIAPTGTNGISVSGVLSPGASVGAIGNLTLDLNNTSGTVVMNSAATFQYSLGSAGIDINTVGSSDLLTLAGAAASDTLAFNGNNINFLGTGAVGFYKLLDSGRDNANTWTGLTVGGTGLITAGLGVSNLTSGLSGNLIMGGNSLGGTTGDIYLQVIPEPRAALLGGLGVLLLLRRRRQA